MGILSLLPTPVAALLREIAPCRKRWRRDGWPEAAAAARDGRQFGVAAALYQEALRFNPDNARMRIQCGHMLKEAGDLVGAEAQYARAARNLPRDADLALQIGHLHKIAGRPEQAAASYRPALELSPGWREAERELATVSSAEADGEAHAGEWDGVVPHLLPRGVRQAPATDRNILRLFRLGGRRTHSRWGDFKTLRGIEAIRGYRLAGPGIAEIRLLIDGEAVLSEPLQVYPQGETGTQFKYVFNLWHDFSAVAPGRHLIELGFHDASGGRTHRHQETVLIMGSRDAADFAQSDSFVKGAAGTTSIEEAVNARPSRIRTIERALLPDPVRTILVQRVDQLGDLVCSVPAIRRLREIFPAAKLVGLLTPANRTLAESLGLFDEIVTVPFTESAAERRRVLPIEAQDALRTALLPYRFDIAIDLGEGEESRALLLLSGARFLYGFKDRLAPWLDAGLEFNANDPINGIAIVPPSRKMMLLVEGLRMLAEDQAVMAQACARPDLSAYGIGANDRYAAIHSGARLAYSRWPYFDALVAMLLERTDLKILSFCDDEAAALAMAGSAGDTNRLHVVSGQIPFTEFDALLAHCSLFVGNDSGPKHLAALRGAPVVSLHMARLNWREWGQEMSGRIISRRVPCAGCGIGMDGEDCGKDFACLRHIRPEEVFAAARELLEAAA